MGLLDSIGLDPQTLAMAGGLLSPGSFGQGLARGVEGSQNAQLRQQQILAAQQEQAMRDLQMQRTRQQLAFGSQFLSDTGGATPSTVNPPSTMPAASAALASGAQNGSVGPTNANAATMGSMAQPTVVTPQVRSKLGQLTQDQIAAGVVSGVIPKELVELWQNEKFGRALPPGWKQNLDGSMIYVPDPTKGVTIGPDGKTVQTMPGATQTLGDIAAATKGGEMRATNANTLLPLDYRDRMSGLAPGVTIGDLVNPGPEIAARAPNSTFAANLSADIRRQGITAPNLSGITPTGQAQPATAFKTPAQLSAEKIVADNQANLATQPALISATDYAKNVQANDKDYAAALDKKVEEGFNLKRRNAEILQNIQDYQTGIGGADARVHLASNLKNLFPDNPTVKAVAEKINGGSVVSAQTLNNLVAGAMVTNAIQVLDGQGRLTKAITSQLQQAAESAATDPGALKRIMDIQNRFADQDFTEQQARAAALRSGTYNPATWQADYAKQKWDGMNTPGSNYAPTTGTPSGATLRWNPQKGALEPIK